ncbi:MAG: hypothetical protein IJV65_10425 [Kiritimatiellae bacterium]|nr:hypothetical protein [Kiritimatiellia bacterium]
MSPAPICHVVAGPNGSGKSTFALRYLPRWAGNVEFVNPDLIAQGESPLDIRPARRRAANLVAQFKAVGRPVPPDLGDRLAADARSRLADDLLYADEVRRMTSDT